MQTAARPRHLSVPSGKSVVLAVLATFSGCVPFVDGAIRLSGGLLGEREFKPDTCNPGVRLGFFGADLYTRDVAAEIYQTYQKALYMRLVSDVIHGPLVRVYSPLIPQGYIQFTAANCRPLQVDVENHGRAQVNLTGKVVMQCGLEDGTKATGTLSFTQCQ